MDTRSSSCENSKHKESKGYNLSDACRGDGERGDDGAEEIELEVSDRRDADSHEQDHEGGLDALAERFKIVKA